MWFDQTGLTLSSRDTSLAEILDELSSIAGIDIIANDPLAEIISIELGPQSIDAVIESLLAHRNYTLAYPNARASAPNALFVLGFRQEPAHASFVLSLTDPDKAVRMDSVIDQMDELDDESRLQAISMALADEDIGVRMEAVDALAGLPDEQALDLLSMALADPDAEVREAAIDAFAGHSGDGAANALGGTLTDTSVSVREEAVYALGRMSGPAAINSLRQALSDPDETIRETARVLLSDLEAH